MGKQRSSKATRYPGISKVVRGETIRYVVSYRLRGVGQRTKTFHRLAEARAFQADTRNPERVRRLVNRERGRIPVAEYFDAWLVGHHGLRPTTRRRYEDIGRMYVAEFPIGRMDLVDVEREDVKAWISALQRADVGVPTIDKSYRTLRACFTEAVKDGKLELNPARAITTPKAPKRKHFYLTPAEVDAIATHMPDRDQALLRFLAYSGVRIGEASALRIKHLDLLRRRVVIAESSSELAGVKLPPGPTKTGVTRVIPLFSDLVDELAAHLEAFGARDEKGRLDPDAFVFTSEKGSMLRQNNWRGRVLQHAARKAGVVRAANAGDEPRAPNSRDLRHTAASLMAAHGFSLLETSRILGHASIKTTADLYADLFEDVTAERAERFGEAIRVERARHEVIPISERASVSE